MYLVFSAFTYIPVSLAATNKGHVIFFIVSTLPPNILLLLLPALQPTVGFGLSNKILPFFTICHQLSPSSLNPSSFSFVRLS
jgi:hypothetical protein